MQQRSYEQTCYDGNSKYGNVKSIMLNKEEKEKAT